MGELILDGRVTMRAQVHGPQSAPPVLAFHGWLDNAGTFAALAPLLDAVRLVAVDLPGHGLSDPLPPAMSYHFMDHLQDIHVAVKSAGSAPVRLLGHSMGGALALAYAAAFPELVSSVVSIDALGPMGDRPEHTARRLRDAVLARASSLQRGRLFDSRDAALAAREGDEHVSRAGVEQLAARGLAKEPGGWRWTADRRLRWPSITRLTESQVVAMLDEVRCPVLLVQARDSQFRMPENLRAIRFRALRDARVVELPGGHHLHLDDPALTAQAINEFWVEVMEA